MKRMRKGMAMAVAAVLLATPAMAGCGGDDSDGTPQGDGSAQQEELSKQRYTDELRTTMVELGTELQAVNNASTPEDLDLSLRQLRRLGDVVRRTVDDFGAIDPPEDVQEGHDRILAALEDFSSKYGDVLETVEADGKVTEESFTALRTAAFELQDQYLQAQETLIDAGIEMGVTQVGG